MRAVRPIPLPPAVRRLRARVRAHPRWRWYSLAVVALGMMMSVVNVSIVNIALPAMAADLDADVTTMGWVVTAFLVTMATLLPIAGRAGDLYGRRRVFLIGILICTIGSVLCVYSWDAGSLIAFRVVQGVGACAMAPTAVSYAAELFEHEERGAALGVLGGIMGLAPVVSLNLAGVLVGATGWRSVFWFTPVIAIVVVAGAVVILEELPASGGPQRFDIPGALLAAAALVGLLLAFSRGDVWGWTSPATVAAGLIGVVGAVTFLTWERRADQPMMDLSLFRLRSLRTANFAAGASSAALFGSMVLLPFFLVGIHGLSPLRLALSITPIALSFVLVSPLAGRAMTRGHISSHRLAWTGLVIAAAGTATMAATAHLDAPVAVVPGMIGLGVGLAAATSPITTTAISEVPRERLGVASALPNISRYTGASIGVAVLGAVLHAVVPDRLESLSDAVAAADRPVVADGFRDAMIVATGFLLLAAVSASRMPQQRSRRDRPVTTEDGLPGASRP